MFAGSYTLPDAPPLRGIHHAMQFLTNSPAARQSSSCGIVRYLKISQPLATRFSQKSYVEGRSVTITDEFRTPRGYGSVWIVAAGIEPTPIGALPITIRAAIRYMTSIFTVACLLARH